MFLLSHFGPGEPPRPSRPDHPYPRPGWDTDEED